MSSRFLSVLLLCLTPLSARVIRVCADPNNLPYSNQAGEGFENRLAELVAKDLGASLDYFWWPDRKSFIEKTLNQGRCDVVMGVPRDLNSVLTTQPYYRSTYVLVSRKDSAPSVTSLLDPRLENWRIGVQIVGDDYAAPATILARRGLTSHLVAASPAARIVEAVSGGEVDLGIVWGPFAGYFAQRARVPLTVAPVNPPAFAGVPFTYDISAGVRKDDLALKADIEGVLAHECVRVRALLDEYGVPQIMEGTLPCASSPSASASLH